MTSAPLILVVDDEEVMRDSCRQALELSGWRVVTAEDGFAAIKALHFHRPDLIILDLKMPGLDGKDFLQRVKDARSDLDVIVITAYSSVGSAVECMRLGAYDYLPKPFEPDALRLAVTRALEKRRLAQENRELRRQLAEAPEVLVGESPGIRKVRDVIDKVAMADSTVLILGESGTGKELVARAIHRKSSRQDRPFVAVDCNTLVQSLCESELFGHVKGAFTSAGHDRTGRFELAAGGTVFLDEIGNVEPQVQGKLLRVIQEREITRVGASQPVKVDVRIIAATNQDLPAALRAQRFREDLYYRLSVVQILIPPLRDRREDIPLLADSLVRRLVDRKRLVPRPVSDEALRVLQTHDWPGNVRELENTLERALLMAQGTELQPEDLDFPTTDPIPNATATGDDLRLTAIEAQQIRKVIDMTGGRLGQAAALLGIDRKTLYRKLREYDLR